MTTTTTTTTTVNRNKSLIIFNNVAIYSFACNYYIIMNSEQRVAPWTHTKWTRCLIIDILCAVERYKKSTGNWNLKDEKRTETTAKKRTEVNAKKKKTTLAIPLINVQFIDYDFAVKRIAFHMHCNALNAIELLFMMII